MSEQPTQPNQTAKDLDNQRQKSLSDFVKEKKFGKKSEDSPENKEKSEKKLDNDQKNDYINNEEGKESDEKTSDDQKQTEDKSSEDDEASKYEEILNNQFNGDAKKAVKSWIEGQKSYTKLRKQAKDHEKKLNYLDEVVNKNPLLGDLFKKAASEGKVTKNDLQNFLGEDKQEPNGKPSASSESKLESIDEGTDISDIDESTLAEAGYINPDKKESLSPTEWNILKRQASVKYAEDKLPERLAQQAFSKFQKQIDQEKQQREQAEQQKTHRRINEERYEQGLDKVVEQFNLDFANNEEHESMLDDIEQLATNIRDPRNNNVIHKNAIYLATLEVMEDKGIQASRAVDVDKETEKAKQEADKSFDKRTGFNANTKQTGQDKPETLADKLAKRHLSEYQKEHDKRVKTGRVSSSD